MAELVSQMTKEELRKMIDEVLEQKLIELFGDPDEGLELRDEIRESLIRQREAVARGELGRPLEDVVKELGID
jgi:hypothetical protein